MRIITYSDKEMQIVRNGIRSIEQVLLGTDEQAKLRLLCCLDRSLDPWFGYNLPYAHEITDVLQWVVVQDNPIAVKEDALLLLAQYCGQPFAILENNLAKIEPKLIAQVEEIINMA